MGSRFGGFSHRVLGRQPRQDSNLRPMAPEASSRGNWFRSHMVV
jgi:hypothetical protein